jgi:hypothetical protein
MHKPRNWPAHCPTIPQTLESATTQIITAGRRQQLQIAEKQPRNTKFVLPNMFYRNLDTSFASFATIVAANISFI